MYYWSGLDVWSGNANNNNNNNKLQNNAAVYYYCAKSDLLKLYLLLFKLFLLSIPAKKDLILGPCRYLLACYKHLIC